MKMNSDSLLSFGMLAFGLAAVGYAIGIRSHMKSVAEKLDASIDKIADDMEVEISQKLIEHAVQKAVDRESYTAVRKATDVVIDSLKKEINDQVSMAVRTRYANISDDVTSEIAKNVAKIDETHLKREVIAKAKEQIAEKFDDKLDDLLGEFNGNLQNLSRVYKSIAKSFSKEDI